MMQKSYLPQAPNEKIHIGIGQVKPRPHNPTYTSTFMNASLCCLSPPNNYTKSLIKQTSYKSSFQTPGQSPLHYQNAINYHRVSHDALIKKRYAGSSSLSTYGTNLLNKM